MATTKLWSRSASNNRGAGSIIQDTVNYVVNEDKTKNIEIVLADDDFVKDSDTINSVLKYVVNEKKTKIEKDSFNKLEELYVSSLNCDVNNVDEEFMLVKNYWAKSDKILLWHGVQSFTPGEVDPNTAHEIGIKLANRMWGDNFQIVVTTHCDKAHIHNHFVFNSVSFVDGKKYHYSKKEIYRLRKESDRLCNEYNLSVIQHTDSRADSYYDWLNSGKGKTVRALIKEDLDLAIENSNTLREVYVFLETQLGYEVNRTHKYTTLRPPKSTKAFRVDNLDKHSRNPNHKNMYTEEAIVQRLTGTVKNKPILKSNSNFSYKDVKYTFSNNDKMDAVDFVFGKSIRNTYWHYHYLLNNMKELRTQYPKSHFEIRKQAQKKLHKYNERVEFLTKNHIETVEELNDHKNNLCNIVNYLKDNRNSLREDLWYANQDKQETIALQIESINNELKIYEKDYRICNEVLNEYFTLSENLSYIEKEKQQNKKDNERTDEKWQQKMQ